MLSAISCSMILKDSINLLGSNSIRPIANDSFDYEKTRWNLNVLPLHTSILAMSLAFL